MMKKLLLFGVALMGLMSSVSAATTLLKEGFEGASFPPAGWSVINDTHPETVCHWILDNSSALSEKQHAYCDGGKYMANEPKKEEWLITPEISLGSDSYKLEYKWSAAWVAAEKKEYDVQIRATTDNGETWTTIWSFMDRKMVEESGLVYPWAAWVPHTSVVNISAYRSQRVKFAFVHCNLIGGSGKGNSIKIDDVLIEDYNPITAPIVSGSSSYTFPASYIGTKKYSEAMQIKNVGIDTLRIESANGLEGTDFTLVGDWSKLKLGPQESASYQIAYQPTLTGARAATLQLHTNGGTLEVKVEGSKIVLANGYNYEGFESPEFPPIGWSRSTDDWKASNYALAGDRSAIVSLTKNSELVSPRLDLSTGSHQLTFTMFEQFEPSQEGVTAPDNYFDVLLSTDGGMTWQTIFENNTLLNQTRTVTLDLKSPASDNCLVKWVYDCEQFGDWENLPEFSSVFMDEVILPPYYGRDSRPSAAANPSPAIGMVDIYNQDIQLSWQPVQFATGYKVYVGTSESSFELINGLETAQPSYKLNQLAYKTKYYWKVVPYNSKGLATEIPVWSFTTMSDQSIVKFPFFEGFESEQFPSLGWVVTNNQLTRWSPTTTNPYEGKVSAMVSGNTNNSQAVLQTPEVVLPSDKNMQISFYWGNTVPVSLAKGATVVSNDSLYFEVKSEGVWITTAAISAPTSENQKWKRERIMLTKYKGQTVTFRWRYSLIKSAVSTGGGLDNILIEAAPEAGKAVVNVSNYSFGEVNYMKSLSSKGLTILNDGESELTIESVSFTNKNFVCSLNPGLTLSTREKIDFSITFNAGTTNAALTDEMVVTFTNQVTCSLPISATALNNDIYYFSFEEDTYGSLNPNGLTTIDVDKSSTVRPVLIKYPNYGAAFAYIVINQKPAPEGADWRNIYPRSGDQLLAAMSPTSKGLVAEDWIVSPRLSATTKSQFRFYAKSYGGDFERSKVTILVSTTDANKESFAPLASFGVKEVPFIANKPGVGFTEFVADLSQFEGQAIYIALKHTTPYEGFVTFLDDFYYEHFAGATAGNSAPVFTTVAPTAAIVNQPYSYSFGVNDSQQDPLTITTQGLPNWLTCTTSTNGGVISGTPTEAGEYLFRIKAHDGEFTTIQEVELEVKVSDGIFDLTESGITISSNDHYIFIEGSYDGRVALYNIAGEAIMEGQELSQIAISGLNRGVYLLRIENNNRVFSTKIIK